MYLRLLVIGLLAACFLGCTDDPSAVRAGSDAGPGFAGSCDFEAMNHCEEYAETDADADTAGACTNSSGAWSTGKCPFFNRSAVCTAGTGGTRTYAYGADAASKLESTCPPKKFVAIADPSGTGGAVGTGGTGGGGATGGTGGMDAAVDDDAGL